MARKAAAVLDLADGRHLQGHEEDLDGAAAGDLVQPSPAPVQASAPPDDGRTQIGRPVQFWYPRGQGADVPPQLVAAVLLGPSRTDGRLWNLEVCVPNTMVRVVKAACGYSEQPAPGRWRHIPE